MIVLVDKEPTRGQRVKLVEKRISFAVISSKPTDEDLTTLATRIQRTLEEVRLPFLSPPRATGAIRTARGVGPGVASDRLTELTRRFNELWAACEALTSATAQGLLERELAFAEDEFTHAHYPACVLHLARALEGLVLHLADRWDARPDVRLLRDTRALRDGVDSLAETLSSPDHDERRARKRGMRLVEAILEMLLPRAGDADAMGEDGRTIHSTLNDIGRRWRREKAVRAAVSAAKEDLKFRRFQELRNAIAHARPSGREAETGEAEVIEMIDGALALVAQLRAMRDVIEPLLVNALAAAT